MSITKMHFRKNLGREISNVFSWSPLPLSKCLLLVRKVLNGSPTMTSWRRRRFPVEGKGSYYCKVRCREAVQSVHQHESPLPCSALGNGNGDVWFMPPSLFFCRWPQMEMVNYEILKFRCDTISDKNIFIYYNFS